MSEKLLSCPFCGGEAKIQDTCIAIDGWFVACLKCDASSMMIFPGKVTNDETRKILTEAWNRRPK